MAYDPLKPHWLDELVLSPTLRAWLAVRAMNYYTPSQTEAAFYNDGTESGSVVISSGADSVSVDVSSDIIIFVRVRVQESGAAASASTDDFDLWASLNSGAYAAVTTTSTALGVIAATSTNVVHGNATTNRLGAGSGSWQAGEIAEIAAGNVSAVEDFTHNASTYTEHLYVVQLKTANLSNGNTLDFRVRLNGAEFTGGYTVTPRITAVKAVIKTYTGSGGIVFGGNTALHSRTKAYVVGGAISFGGAATTSHLAVRAYAGSGTITFGGTATTSKSRTYTCAGSAQLTLSGVAALACVRVPVVTGGLVLGGTAAVTRTKAYAGSGTISFVGAAAVSKTKVPVTSASVTLGGTAATSKLAIHAYSGSGAISFGGTAATSLTSTKVYAGSGTISFGGTAATLLEGAVTTLYPTSVTDLSTYTRENGSTVEADILAGLNTSDSLYVRSPTHPATTTFKVAFVSLNPRPGVRLSYEYGKDAAQGERIDQTIELRKNGVMLKTATHANVGMRPLTAQIDLSDLTTMQGVYEVWLTDTEVA